MYCVSPVSYSLGSQCQLSIARTDEPTLVVIQTAQVHAAGVDVLSCSICQTPLTLLSYSELNQIVLGFLSVRVCVRARVQMIYARTEYAMWSVCFTEMYVRVASQQASSWTKPRTAIAFFFLVSWFIDNNCCEHSHWRLAVALVLFGGDDACFSLDKTKHTHPHSHAHARTRWHTHTQTRVMIVRDFGSVGTTHACASTCRPERKRTSTLGSACCTTARRRCQRGTATGALALHLERAACRRVSVEPHSVQNIADERTHTHKRTHASTHPRQLE